MNLEACTFEFPRERKRVFMLHSLTWLKWMSGKYYHKKVEIGVSHSLSAHTHTQSVPILSLKAVWARNTPSMLWLPASILVIVILPDLLARSWRQKSQRFPSTSPNWLTIPPTPWIIQTSCCKVPGLLPPTPHCTHTCVLYGLEFVLLLAFFGSLSVLAWGLVAA